MQTDSISITTSPSAKSADRIIDFDTSEGDQIVVDQKLLESDDPEMALAETKKDLKDLSKEGLN